MVTCEHLDFEAFVEVHRIVERESPAEPHSFACEVRVTCRDCGERFGFRAPDVGLLPDRPAVSPDALELRVPLISPAELELLGPLAAMRASSGHPGFRIRFRPTGR